MSQVEWQFYGGIDTIGGTIIRIQYEKHRLLFDMGRVFNPGGSIFDSLFHSRGIRDLQRVGLVPRIPGLFDDGTEAENGTETLVMVSHSHLDHIGLLPYLRTDIPVLLTEDTLKLIRALDEVLDGPKRELQYLPVKMHAVTEFGPFRITVLPVDHDTPGACAFLIESPELKFVYSGDLRLHGAHPEMTRQFAETAREFKPDVLWIEGTRSLSQDNTDILSEPELPKHLTQAISSCDKGVYFTFYPRHPQRLVAFQQAADHTNRSLVLEGPSAYIFEKFGGNVSSSFIYGGGSDQWTDRLKQWIAERRLQVLYPEDLKNKEHLYVVEIPYRRLTDFIDIDVKPGGLFIHSNGSPLGPFDPAWNHFMQWLSIFKLNFAAIGSTGHGSRGDILSIAETIQPRVLMPIHSLRPEFIGLPTINRLMPEYQKVYQADDLRAAVKPTPEELALPDQ